MNNRFEICCHDYELVRKTSQCEQLYCSGDHMPEFCVIFHKENNTSCYCLNRKQLGQYWQCIIKDRLYPRSCGHCQICRQVSHVFSELQDSFFFSPRVSVFDEIPLQPVAWRIFSAKTEIYIEIAKSKKSAGIITAHGEVC